MITRPVRERTITGIGAMVEQGLKATGYEEVGLLSLSSADHSEIGELAKGLADRYEGTRRQPQPAVAPASTRSTSPWPTSSPATAAARGLTFAPEGGSERIRKVINKMVSKEDLVRTVTTAYANGWRQVKLYFMCGLPTETDEDVLEIADLAVEVIRAGREASGQQGHPLHGVDRRVRAQAAHAVPVGRAGQRRRRSTTGCGCCAQTINEDRRDRPLDRAALPRRQARRRSRDCCPAATAGSAG